jgi:hypothetical protein
VDSYKIAVSIVLANGVSSVLNTISQQMLGLNTTVGQVNNNFARMAQVIGGVAAVMGGVEIFRGMAGLVEHGSEVNHQLELMKVQGMEVKEINDSMAASMKTVGDVMTTTLSGNLQHVRELRYAFGDTDTALKYLDAVSKANSVLNSVKGGSSDQVWELVKSLEMKGLTADPDSFMSYVDTMTKATVASGGKVTPQQFMSAFKYGRTSMFGWDETFVGQYLPRLIQSMSSGSGGGGGSGSGGPGNALMSAFAKVVQGQMPKKAAEEFERMGLASNVRPIKGSSESLTDGIAGRDQFMANPYEWVQKTLMPALAAHGITEQNDITEEVSKLFPVRTASQIIGEMALFGSAREGENSPFEKDARLARGASGTGSYDELIKKDPTTVMQAFHAQLKSLFETLGSPIAAQATEWMVKLNGAIATMGQFAGAHPEGIKVAVDALAGLATGLVVAGIVALGAAIAGLVGVAGGIAAAAAGLATIAALNWSSIAAGLDSFNAIPIKLADAMNSVNAAVASELIYLGTTLINGIKEAVSSVVAAVPGIFSAIGTAIVNALKSAVGAVGGFLGFGGSGGATPQKQNYNAAPPAPGGAGGDRHAAVYLDGKKVGALITRQIAQRASRPLEGSSYFDNTWHSPASDTAWSMG